MQRTTDKASNYSTLKLLSATFVSCMIALFTLTATTLGEYSLINKVDMNAQFITTDFLKNAYLINAKNEVMKYDSTGKWVARFSDNRYGALTTVDATSPFNILLFFKDQTTLVTTDMQLNTRNLYRLPQIGINNVSAACLAHDNYIWVYDTDDKRLKKVNTNYDIMYRSLSMEYLLGATEIPEPNYLLEKDGLVYLHFPRMGLILFDIMGSYYTSIPYTELGVDFLHSFQVVNQKLIFYQRGNLKIYDIVSKEMKELPVPNTSNFDTRDVKVERNRLYVLKNKELQMYARVR